MFYQSAVFHTYFSAPAQLQSSVARAYRIYLVLYFKFSFYYPYTSKLLYYSYWIIQMDELFVAVKTAVPPFFSSESWYLIAVCNYNTINTNTLQYMHSTNYK